MKSFCRDLLIGILLLLVGYLSVFAFGIRWVNITLGMSGDNGATTYLHPDHDKRWVRCDFDTDGKRGLRVLFEPMLNLCFGRNGWVWSDLPGAGTMLEYGWQIMTDRSRRG